MWAWLAWLLERDVGSDVSLNLAPRNEDALTVGQIDEMLAHWAGKLHTDPDPVSRWMTILTCDRWLDCRLRLTELTNGEAGRPED